LSLRPEHLLKGALDSTAACRPENGILRQLSLSPEGHRLPPDVVGLVDRYAMVTLRAAA